MIYNFVNYSMYNKKWIPHLPKNFDPEPWALCKVMFEIFDQLDAQQSALVIYYRKTFDERNYPALETLDSKEAAVLLEFIIRGCKSFLHKKD